MARTESAWEEVLGSYLKTPWGAGRNILINGTNKYLNFGTTSGESGYGFRDNGGTMQVKNSGGSWANFGAGGGGTVDTVVAGTGISVDATDPANPIVALDTATQNSLDLADTAIQPVTVSGSLTAVLDRHYINVASATYTDPSPSEGKGFIVFVRNGTATVGGTGYSTVGTIVHRIYHSGAWANYVYNVSSTFLATANNLSDLANAATARTNLGLGSAATVATDLLDLNEATIESAIDTLANLTSIQGRTVTLADAGANAIFGWDDVAGAYENLTQAEVRAVIGDAAADGSTKGVATFTASDFNATTGNISIDYTNGQKASETQAGFLTELATSAEINTGTDTARAMSPDAFAGSEFGKRTLAVQVNGSASGSTALATGDGQASIPIDTTVNGMNIVAVKAYVTTVSSSGAVTINIRRSRRSSATARTIVDTLSTAITIDASEFESADATAPAINGSNDDLQTGDMLLIDIDAAGTGVLGLTVVITCQLP